MANTPIPTHAVGDVLTSPNWNDLVPLNLAVAMYTATSPLVGVPPAANAPNFYLQGGTISTTTDGSGHVTLTFPFPFPNGVLTVIGMNGDVGATSNMIVSADQSGSPCTASSILLVCTNPATGAAIPSTGVRINWWAVGY